MNLRIRMNSHFTDFFSSEDPLNSTEYSFNNVIVTDYFKVVFDKQFIQHNRKK